MGKCAGGSVYFDYYEGMPIINPTNDIGMHDIKNSDSCPEGII